MRKRKEIKSERQEIKGRGNKKHEGRERERKQENKLKEKEGNQGRLRKNILENK